MEPGCAPACILVLRCRQRDSLQLVELARVTCLIPSGSGRRAALITMYRAERDQQYDQKRIQ